MSEIDLNKRQLFRREPASIVHNLMPWVHDHSQFTNNCTQCQECIKECPEHIIIKGDGGFPRVDFSLGECTFCGKCAQNCPEEVFVNTSETPWHKKAIISEACLANQNVACRSCSESCPEEALSFKIGINATPEIDLDKCNGCGACFSPCPTSAITIKECK